MILNSPVPGRESLRRAYAWILNSLRSNAEQIAEVRRWHRGGPVPTCPRRATLPQLLRERAALLDPREHWRRASFVEATRLLG